MCDGEWGKATTPADFHDTPLDHALQAKHCPNLSLIFFLLIWREQALQGVLLRYIV
jgi:hypothetical protein